MTGKSALFPALDADIKLTRVAEDATLLAVSGGYRPPLDGLGAGLDRVALHQVAQATSGLSHIASGRPSQIRPASPDAETLPAARFPALA